MYSHLTKQSHYELTFRLSKKMNNVTCRIYFSQKFILDKYVVLLVLDPITASIKTFHKNVR